MLLLASVGMTVSAQSDGVSETPSDTLFYESFDNMAGEGGNDGNWNVSYSLKGWTYSTEGTINEGWSNTLTDVRPANKCILIGTNGNLLSPELANLDGAAVLTFRAGATKNSNVTLKVTVLMGGEFVETGGKTAKLELPKNEFGTFKLIMRGCSSKTRISFTNTGALKAFLLDDVTLTDMVSLDEDKNNFATITRYNGKVVDVVLKRTLSPDCWNTICLPFAMTSQQIADVFGEGVHVAELKSASTLKKTLNFEDVAAMEAGMPYLIRPAAEVSDPIILGVKMQLLTNPMVIKGLYSFIGATSQVTLLAKFTVLGDDNRLKDAEKDGNFYKMQGLRAYFMLPSSQEPDDVTVIVNGTATAIDAIDNAATAKPDGRVFNLNGQQVGKAAHGLYIVNGKKVVLK